MAELTITDQNFDSEIAQSKMPALVDFWAPWCAPCRIVGPIVDELAKEYEGKLKVGKLNVDENSQTAAKFGIMSIPSILIFKNGTPVKTIIGAQGKEKLKKEIEEVLGS
ncbi:MAG: thioredoxin [Candidatus Levybacteria bacterium]|nr:thioredoxin [Candidatus Levybacteria bacterium]